MTLTRLLLCSSLLFSSAPAQFASTGTVTSAPSAERELLLRAMTFDDFTQVEVLPERLPSSVSLSLPAGSRVVGSIVTRTTTTGAGMNIPPSVRVFFDHPLPPDQLRPMLNSTLKQAGFQPMPQRGQPGPPDGGFQTTVSLFGDL